LLDVADRALRLAVEQSGPIPLNITLACEPGQVLALFGPSGCGKTTVLRTIAGLYTPHRARVAIADDVWLDTSAGVNLPPHRRPVGFVFQEYALFPHLSAIGNVMTALGHRPRSERRARAEALLAQVHLTHRADRRPSSLSGGERQRVAVARALAREPRVLLLDEPFSAVDRGLRRALQAEIEAIRGTVDIPIVLVTHEFDDVVRLATHLAILRRGQLAAYGSLESLTSRADLPWLRDSVGLGTVTDATVRRVDAARGLAEIDINGGVLFAAAADLAPGRRVRIRIPAREVILATDVPRGLSVHNVLAGTVSRICIDEASGAVLVQLAIGGTQLLAEVTRDAVARLRITEGMSLHALIKTVSLDVLATESSTPPEPHEPVAGTDEHDLAVGDGGTGGTRK
jgi:molybdate transport system ATP-binding protein